MTGKQIEPGSLGLEWPEAYGDLLPVLKEKWGVSGPVYLNRKLSGGKSGALVYAVAGWGVTGLPPLSLGYINGIAFLLITPI
ncbi:MAG: hypothetical protein AAGC96_17835, partial [Pseudomonadota bacterium]